MSASVSARTSMWQAKANTLGHTRRVRARKPSVPTDTAVEASRSTTARDSLEAADLTDGDGVDEDEDDESSIERSSEACWRVERVMAHPTTARFMPSGSRSGGRDGAE